MSKPTILVITARQRDLIGIEKNKDKYNFIPTKIDFNTRKNQFNFEELEAKAKTIRESTKLSLG